MINQCHRRAAAGNEWNMEFKGTDDFTGIEYSFRLSDVELWNGMISCNIHTSNGSTRISEWVVGSHVERIDSNVRFNDVIEMLFDMAGKPGLMPTEDYLPFNAIYDALDY